ncbi:3,4-dihydroxy-2-butanone-4-phosphate synthase [Neobacillus notoginsengisoli]|uniref:3,4-dihydroxy-2-butanone 4-phosphate synthase n=1 Tax=Neobacillus notoginsengisoli TaxID=1578198 RepID=A0A417YPT5_9BACI|nr:3,4-dihydroxy-2-butanone-4-phosphate synthase [Neobacillus notoginsengisoli]
MFSGIEEAFQDLKAGKVIIVCDDEGRENEGDFVALAEKATPEVINFMATHGRGLICVPLEEKLAEKLDFHPMVLDNTDTHGTAFTVSVDHKFTTTGISAFERSATILSILDSGARPDDFKRPGHIFPLVAKSGGVVERPGHTEAAVDLAKLCGAKPAGVICEIMNEDGTMARVPELREVARRFGLKMITIEDLISYIKNEEHLRARG